MGRVQRPLASHAKPQPEVGTLTDRVVNRIVAAVGFALLAWLVLGSAYLIAALDLTILSALILFAGLVMAFLASRLPKTSGLRTATWIMLSAVPIVAFLFVAGRAIAG